MLIMLFILTFNSYTKTLTTRYPYYYYDHSPVTRPLIRDSNKTLWLLVRPSMEIKFICREDFQIGAQNDREVDFIHGLSVDHDLLLFTLQATFLVRPENEKLVLIKNLAFIAKSIVTPCSAYCFLVIPPRDEETPPRNRGTLIEKYNWKQRQATIEGQELTSYSKAISEAKLLCSQGGGDKVFGYNQVIPLGTVITSNKSISCVKEAPPEACEARMNALPFRWDTFFDLGQKYGDRDPLQLITSVTLEMDPPLLIVMMASSGSIRRCSIRVSPVSGSMVGPCSDINMVRGELDPRASLFLIADIGMVQLKFGSVETSLTFALLDCAFVQNCFSCDIMASPFGCKWTGDRCESGYPKQGSFCVSIVQLTAESSGDSHENLGVSVKFSGVIPKFFSPSILIGDEPCETKSMEGIQIKIEIKPAAQKKPFRAVEMEANSFISVDSDGNILLIDGNSKKALIVPLVGSVILSMVLIVGLGLIVRSRRKKRRGIDFVNDDASYETGLMESTGNKLSTKSRESIEKAPDSDRRPKSKDSAVKRDSKESIMTTPHSSDSSGDQRLHKSSGKLPIPTKLNISAIRTPSLASSQGLTKPPVKPLATGSAGKLIVKTLSSTGSSVQSVPSGSVARKPAVKPSSPAKSVKSTVLSNKTLSTIRPVLSGKSSMKTRPQLPLRGKISMKTVAKSLPKIAAKSKSFPIGKSRR